MTSQPKRVGQNCEFFSREPASRQESTAEALHQNEPLLASILLLFAQT